MSLKINQTITISEDELVEDFVRSSGPGGQNVNKVSSAVQLRFNLKESLSIPEDIKTKLLTSLKNQLTKAGEIMVVAKESRNQKDNRHLVREKLVLILQKALFVQKKRKKTRPTKASQERRLASKQKHSIHKKMRGKVQGDDH
ncbi:MAG: hypothetical protein A2381_19495 [Bdellovibrionales bacterium RIFOXYB1_FULL_37_110]|nr:MAG: hypothetical protein A2417_10995 [Bdellovibrionales bacterium RIFOXYC1_FULL_37_79]OFZ60665.1 MAG: hypothetical protein A2381_19495 [Bdellovibrionales bacterium RIFOXYB1_FULL_37_110]OFZ64417.1 MAG: hypothetical protein A2577_10145 [Bdellovibrionales bacterium RIFOXYD1_FULL_36_51]